MSLMLGTCFGFALCAMLQAGSTREHARALWLVYSRVEQSGYLHLREDVDEIMRNHGL